MTGTWARHADCRDTPATTFDPIRDTRNQPDLHAAQAVAERWCRPCPVRPACHQQALDLGAQDLIQAGWYWPPHPAGTRPINLLAACGDTVKEPAA